MRGFFNQPVEGSADAIVRAKAATPIRLCTVNRATARTPQEECTAAMAEAPPRSRRRDERHGFYFARYLQEVLDVPVGVIVTCWGQHARREAWMDRETMGGFKEFDLSFLDGDGRRSTVPKQALRTLQRHDRTARALHRQGLPLVPGPDRLRPGQYRALMPAFVKMLRERWAQGELPFYYVQIAPYCYKTPTKRASGPLREAQLRATSATSVERHGRDDGHRRREAASTPPGKRRSAHAWHGWR